MVTKVLILAVTVVAIGGLRSCCALGLGSDLDAHEGADFEADVVFGDDARADTHVAVYQRERLRHRNALASIAQQMTVNRALHLLQEQAGVSAGLVAFVHRNLVKGAARTRLRSGQRAGRQDPQVSQDSSSGGNSTIGDDAKHAKEMLNKMIYEVQVQYEIENKKCCDYESTKRNMIEEAAQDIALFNAQSAQARAQILEAQSLINIAEKRIPQLRDAITAHGDRCEKELAALALEMEYAEGGKKVISSVSTMADEHFQEQMQKRQREREQAIAAKQLQEDQQQLQQQQQQQQQLLQAQFLQLAHRHRQVPEQMQPQEFQLQEETHLQHMQPDEPSRMLQLQLQHMNLMSGLPKEVTAGKLHAQHLASALLQQGFGSALHDEPGNSSQVLQERLLIIHSVFADRHLEVQNSLKRLEKNCKHVKESLEGQLSDASAQLVTQQAKLAGATQAQNTADEQNRLKTIEKADMEHEFAAMTGTCHQNYQRFEDQECGLKKIRGELFQLKSPGNLVVFQDCQLAAWQPQACSASCGGGTQHLHRKVVTQPDGGVSCLPLDEVQACNEYPCPVDCQMGDWEPWSGCTSECGGGVTQRIRQLKVRPRAGGRPCGELLEVRSCHLMSCNKDCVLEAWTPWSLCSMACGGGRQRRLRLVKERATGTGLCPNAKSEDRLAFEMCNTKACPEKLQCQTPLDVVLLLDGSGGLQSAGWEAIKQAGVMLVRALTLGGTARVSVILFSGPDSLRSLKMCTNEDPSKPPPDIARECKIQVVSQLSGNTADLASRIKALQWPGGSAFTSMALVTAEAELSLGRPDASSVVLVVTRGKPLSEEQTALAATSLRKKARVMWVPVASRTSHYTYTKWASEPDDENVLPVKEFVDLTAQSTIDRVVSHMCPAITAQVDADCDLIRLNPPEDARTYSNEGRHHHRSSLDSSQAWTGTGQDGSDWVRIDLGSSRSVHGVVMQGRPDADEWVTRYSVSISVDGGQWEDLPDPMEGNRDRNTKVTGFFRRPVQARYIRIFVQAFVGAPSLRAGVLICGHLPNTCYTEERNPSEDARKYSGSTDDSGSSVLDSAQAWTASERRRGAFLQLDLGALVTLRGVVTQGAGDADEWVTRYTIQLSDDGKDWYELPTLFEGNRNRNSKVQGVFPEEVTARYVRIVVQDFFGAPSLRAGVLMCAEPPTVTCSFTVDDVVDNVYYDGKSILDTVTFSPSERLDDWKVTKQVSFKLVPGAYFVVVGSEADARASCAVSGFAIRCNDGRANDARNWQASGTNFGFEEDDDHRTGQGGGWEAPCESTSPFTLTGHRDYVRIWSGRHRHAAFRWRT